MDSTDTPWTPERVEKLRGLMTDGLSAQDIANRLGGHISRCAVLGKVHRLGIARRRQIGRPVAVLSLEERAAKRREVRRQRRIAEEQQKFSAIAGRLNKRLSILRAVSVYANVPMPPEPLPDDPVRDGSPRLTTEMLEKHHCRWIFGDPKTDHHYCGHDRLDGTSYCVHHHVKAHNPPADRVRKTSLDHSPLRSVA